MDVSFFFYLDNIIFFDFSFVQVISYKEENLTGQLVVAISCSIVSVLDKNFSGHEMWSHCV